MAMTKTKKRVDPRKILRGLAGRASSRVRGTSWATRWTSSAEQTARGRPGIGLSTRHAHGASSRGQGSLHATLGRCPGRNRIQRQPRRAAAGQSDPVTQFGQVTLCDSPKTLLFPNGALQKTWKLSTRAFLTCSWLDLSKR